MKASSLRRIASRSLSSARPLWGPALLVAALLPTLSLGLQAVTEQPVEARGRNGRLSRREQVLAQIPVDPTVLINVEYRDMPSSPDILNFGKRSTKALERCLADNVDANNRAMCAVLLEALGDRRALPTLHAALEDWDADVRLRVVRALAAMPDKGSVDPLIKLFKRKDEERHVRSAILSTLASISDQRVVRLLRDQLRAKPKDGSPDFRPSAFRALWANRHMVARTTLVADTRAALRSDNDSLVMAATLAAAELRSPRLVSVLTPLMEHSWEEVRNKAVYALGRIGDKSATKALLAHLPQVRESRMLNNIAFALERLDTKAFYASIKQVVEHKQAVIRLNAAFVLGDVKRPEGLPMLEKALNDPSDYVRTSAIVAVGKLGGTSEEQTQQALRALEPFVSHANLSVRQEAIYAVDALTKGGRRDLIHGLFTGLDPRKHGAAIRRAAIALGKAGDTRVRTYLLNCLLNGRCHNTDVIPMLVKHATPDSNGLVLLSWARRETRLTNLLAQLKPAGTLPIARSALVKDWGRPGSYMSNAAMNVLGALGDDSVSDLLRQREGTRHTWPRLRAQVALARIGDGEAPERLVGELDNLPSEWLPGYARTVARVVETPARQALDPKFEAKQADADVNIALAAAAVRLGWDPDKAIFRFLQALASPSSYERQLAERYLARNRDEKVTWLLRRALSRESRDDTRDRLRAILDRRG